MDKGNTRLPLAVLAIIMALGFVLAGCSSPRDKRVIYPFYKKIEGKKRISRLKKVLRNIRKRNQTVENSPQWIEKAYEGLMLRNLSAIPEAEYPEYKKYAKRRKAFVIVHPAYYTFFFNDTRTIGDVAGISNHPDNLVERFYGIDPLFDDSMRLMQEQERMLGDFIEVLSREKLLIVLLVPKDYREHINKLRVGENNEYDRYLNEVANESESVLWVESKFDGRGWLLPEDMDRLINLFTQARVKTVYVGGGFIGHCLNDFYDTFKETTEARGLKGIMRAYVVPEISSVSPEDLDLQLLDSLFTSSNGINYKNVKKLIVGFKPKIMFQKYKIPRTKRFHLHEFKLSARD